MRFLLTLLVLLSACGSKPPAAEIAPASAPSTTPIHIPTAVSASAIAVAVIDLPAGWTNDFMRGLTFDAAELKALEADVLAYMKKTTGLDVGGLHRAAIVVTPGPQLALIIEEVSGTLTLPTGDDKLKAVMHDKTLIVGTAAGVSAAEDALAGKGERLVDGKGGLYPLIKDELPGAIIVAAGDLTALPAPDLVRMTEQFGVKQVVASVGSRGIHVLARGDGDKLAKLAAMAQSEGEKMVKALEDQRQAMLERASPERGPDPDALGVIIGAHSARHFFKLLTPKVDKDSLRLALEIGGGGAAGAVMAVSVVGMLAAVAIPAFMKYVKKSKTAEAVQMVKRLSDGARSYYIENAKFPPRAIGPFPPLGECCKGEGGKCQPAAKDWEEPAWTDLKFAMTDPYAYSYQYQVTDSGYTVSAFGDLDCDGVYSTFEIQGMVKEGAPTTSGGLFMNQEIE